MLMSMISAPCSLGDAGALRHPVRFAAGELHDMGARSRAFGAQHRIAAALDEGIACRHLRYDEASAQAACEPPERRVGDSGHGRQNHAVLHRNASDLEDLV